MGCDSEGGIDRREADCRATFGTCGEQLRRGEKTAAENSGNATGGEDRRQAWSQSRQDSRFDSIAVDRP